MVADPGQKHDIAQQQPELTAKLKAAYDKWSKEVSAEAGGRFPIPVGYAEMPQVEVPTPEGRWTGGLKFGGRHANNNWLAGWTRLDASVTWDLEVVHAGPYEATLKYICPKEDVGSKVRVEAGGASVEGVIDKAQEPNFVPSPDRVPRAEVYERQWALKTLGTLRLPKGSTKLTIKALTKPGKAVMDLKALLLRRLD
jgi:arylsulfatase A